MRFFSATKKPVNTKRQAARNPTAKASKASIKPFVIAGLMSLFVVIIVVINEKLSDQIMFPITAVEVRGQLNNITKHELEQIVLNDLKKGFFDINLNNIANEIESKNWVAQATLRRVWPNKVEVLIREHQAYAVWDDKTLLSSNGILFSVSNSADFKHLALINGQHQHAKKLLLAYSQLEQLLRQKKLTLISLTAVKSDEMIIQFNTDLTAVFSLTEKDKQFSRFVALLDNQFIQYRKQHNTITDKAVERIDMRYSNGFSVVWKEPSSRVNSASNFTGNCSCITSMTTIHGGLKCIIGNQYV